MRNDADIIGTEVVAIAYITFSEIGIYGMGKLIDSNEDHYTVEVADMDDKKILVECDSVTPIGNWASFVDETDAEVKRIPYNS